MGEYDIKCDLHARVCVCLCVCVRAVCVCACVCVWYHVAAPHTPSLTYSYRHANTHLHPPQNPFQSIIRVLTLLLVSPSSTYPNTILVTVTYPRNPLHHAIPIINPIRPTTQTRVSFSLTTVQILQLPVIMPLINY
jgi:hypothetical protein